MGQCRRADLGQMPLEFLLLDLRRQVYQTAFETLEPLGILRADLLSRVGSSHADELSHGAHCQSGQETVLIFGVQVSRLDQSTRWNDDHRPRGHRRGSLFHMIP